MRTRKKAQRAFLAHILIIRSLILTQERIINSLEVGGAAPEVHGTKGKED